MIGRLISAIDRAGTPFTPGKTLLDRMVFAVEKDRERLFRAVNALGKANVAYAVAGGNAVAAWVATVDSAAVRNTQDVDILLRRSDLHSASRALEAAGFIYNQNSGVDMFLDGPNAGIRDAVYVLPIGEKIRPDYNAAAPDVNESTATDQFQLLDLKALVRMKLTSFRRKDQVHLLDLLGVGLIDATWPRQLPDEMGVRLQELIDTRDD